MWLEHLKTPEKLGRDWYSDWEHLNLFNLLPLGPLDGGRAFRALARPGRWLAVAVLATAWWATREGLLLLLLVIAGQRALAAAPALTDRRAMLEFVVLVVALSALLFVPEGI